MKKPILIAFLVAAVFWPGIASAEQQADTAFNELQGIQDVVLDDYEALGLTLILEKPLYIETDMEGVANVTYVLDTYSDFLSIDAPPNDPTALPPDKQVITEFDASGNQSSTYAISYSVGTAMKIPIMEGGCGAQAPGFHPADG